MPPKKSDATPGMKLLGLYWLLLFTGREYSLTQLAKELECSKPTVLRLIEQLEVSRLALVDSRLSTVDGQRWYKLKNPAKLPRVTLTVEDIQNLLLCRDMVWHLLPDSLRRSVSKAIGYANVLLPDFADRSQTSDGWAQARTKGGVDYAAKEGVIGLLLKGMRERKICKLTYRKPGALQPKEYFWAPFRLITHRDALYAKGWLMWKDGIPPDIYEMTLAVHRIDSLELTKRKTPKDLKGGQVDECHTFGLIEGNPFRTRIAFTPSAACYVSERTWSKDQKLEPQPDGGVILEFTSTSRPEVIALVLSFGAAAKVLEPDELAQEVKDILLEAASMY
jgi:predicted DNA-binding transcriptional regulator YafY